MEASERPACELLFAKAFRSKLVPQAPRDEPASELLARIRSARDNSQTVQKAAGTRKAARIK